MEPDFYSFETDALKALYEQRVTLMQTRLIDGATWNDLQEDRFTITKMGMELHRRAFPAEKINFVEVKLKLEL